MWCLHWHQHKVQTERTCLKSPPASWLWWAQFANTPAVLPVCGVLHILWASLMKSLMLCTSGGDETPKVLIHPVKDVKPEQNVHKQWSPLCSATEEKILFRSVLVLFSFVALFCFGLSCFYWLAPLLSRHYFYLSALLSLFLLFLILPNSSLRPSADIVMLLHTTLSRLKRWSHEWSLQFKSTQPSRRLKWIFCIYSCNNDSIWGYYLQTVAEFSAALITE